MASPKRVLIVTLVCIAVAAGILVLVRAAQAGTTLLVHAGAGIRPPLDELGEMFEKKTGIRVDYNYKGSGCLLADICFAKKGDCYIPGELFYVEQARKRDFIRSSKVVAQMSTVVIVQKGNSKNIQGLKDLTRRGLRVGTGDPQAVAAGRAANETMVKAGVLKDVERNVVMRALNVVELGIGVKLKHLDAAIVWDATAHLFRGDVETITLPEAWRVEAPIPVGVLAFSGHPREAERFMDFLASEEAGEVFVKHGYGLAPKPNSTGKSEGK
jgi:molybdate transport system substrate-binding protein